MSNKLLTLEKAPFLTVALFSYGLAFRYYEDLKKALPKSADYDHAFSLFIIFLLIGTLSIGCYMGFIIAERNVTRNLEKTKRSRKSQ